MTARGIILTSIRHPIRERFLSKAGLALRACLWLFWVTAALRIYTIPTLLQRIGRDGVRRRWNSLELLDAIRIVTRISNLTFFRSVLFPKQCLRQSLALYRTLRRMGYPVQIHFGVLKDGRRFEGHSWVTMQGERVADTAPGATFQTIFSYPGAESVTAAGRSSSETKGMRV